MAVKHTPPLSYNVMQNHDISCVPQVEANNIGLSCHVSLTTPRECSSSNPCANRVTTRSTTSLASSITVCGTNASPCSRRRQLLQLSGLTMRSSPSQATMLRMLFAK